MQSVLAQFYQYQLKEIEKCSELYKQAVENLKALQLISKLDPDLEKELCHIQNNYGIILY